MAFRQKTSRVERFIQVALVLLLLPLLLPILLIALVLHFLSKTVLYLTIWLWWVPKGKDILFVSSNSPIWQGYMATEIFPLVADRAVVLNWSERTKWSRLSLPVRVFRSFSGQRDFNPMVLVFRPLRRARVFRFLPALKEWKHGHTANLDQIRRDLMLAL